MAVIPNKFYGRVSVGQTLDTWQTGELNTIRDIERALNELQRTLANNDRLLQAFFEKFQNPFQTGRLVIGAQTVLALAVTEIVIKNDSIQIGKYVAPGDMQAPGNFGGSRIEMYAEGVTPAANAVGSDDLRYIYGPASWADQRSSPETSEIVFLQAGGNCDIRVYDGFNPHQIRLDQTSGGFRDLIDLNDTLVLMKGGSGIWHEISYVSY